VIFIIDDDKYVLRGFQIFLRSAGLDSRVFEGADEFIRSWVPAEDDLLIMDMHMPGVSGCDLLDYLEARNSHVPVIVVTAFDEEESRHRADRYGAVAYLTKPVDSEKLLELIISALKRPIEFLNH
jgi:FixJ family two-component response regulator